MNAGCNIGFEEPNDLPNDEAADAINKMVMDGLPPEKLLAMHKYTLKLRKKHPHIKPERLKRRVADYFKVKLV